MGLYINFSLLSFLLIIGCGGLTNLNIKTKTKIEKQIELNKQIELSKQIVLSNPKVQKKLSNEKQEIPPFIPLRVTNGMKENEKHAVFITNDIFTNFYKEKRTGSCTLDFLSQYKVFELMKKGLNMSVINYEKGSESIIKTLKDNYKRPNGIKQCAVNHSDIDSKKIESQYKTSFILYKASQWFSFAWVSK